MKLSADEIRARQQIIKDSLATLQIARLQPSKHTLDDIHAWTLGSLSLDELMIRVHIRTHQTTEEPHHG